ncbi:hypothetical protein HHK36_000220 [Tetracentron sinense]|uniref:[Histone H3]-trimethyl-L-lysine(4) demethylase n=1 Tax=Tetracentron sinense TaxID=13715 RepID=A0A834ZQP7_TETSI|nr:hypothetical protein HHK36_000220 [Tetracentron sinense]
MGKGRPRAVEKGVLGQSYNVSSPGALNIPQGPVFYPTEEEFKDPLEFIHKIRSEAEPYGICRIVPPKSWKPPFVLDLNSFNFQTKTQAIHQLQARPAACDSETFELEYNRFLEDHCGRKLKKRAIFDGEELDLCKIFNAVKRYGGYDKVVKEKKWGEIFRFVRPVGKISECSKHVMCQLYREYLYDYENYHNRLNHEKHGRKFKRGMRGYRKSVQGLDVSSSKRRRRDSDFEGVKVGRLEKEEEFDQICEQCRSGLHGEVMLLCDRCNKGWHIYCLSPPLKQVPPGNWYCLDCLNSDKDSFGFVPGKRFLLEVFRRMADRAKRKWFGTECVSRQQIEKRFWEIVEGSLGEVEVLYGSDLDTSKCGSGFPRVDDPRPPSIEIEVWDKYSASPWNLNNLPKLQGSMLRAVRDNIPGVMVPWLYIGMLFSSFCWHFEDHCFYSMNYLHWGEPKCWYSVPGCEAHAFEKVMRNSLPDLFDVQPDLLFQLVTMLNPSVLQENGVPVYSVLQEPGNFVITFPRSFHGGFNFGLNCAEAVNFAPADWLPHGGFGAELYQSYHKAAVLSHEELLCVLAKSDWDSKVLPYLKNELLRIFAKEKTWREILWRNGIISSSAMSPRKHPEYVDTEEVLPCTLFSYDSPDPTCIICRQYLYLSAVVCNCRPSAFVCLEVKGELVTQAQVADGWLLSSSKIFQIPFSSDVYISAVMEAEQFLWAGHEMDAVRDMVKKLIEAQKWAEDIRDCLSKVETWLLHCDHNVEKVPFIDIDNLLNFNPLPCNEPGHLKLKVNKLNSSCNSSAMTFSLQFYTSTAFGFTLYSDFPIHLDESGKLAREISSAKVWISDVRKCISEKRPAAIGVDMLYKLKSEMDGLQVQLPEMELLSDLLRHVESWKIRCSEILKGPISRKKLDVLLQESDNFAICIPELKLLRRFHCDAVSWSSRFHHVLVNIQEREDQNNVVEELNCILKDGALLRVQVDELPLVEIELKKACCREKALMARGTRMSMDFLHQLVADAVILRIESEKLFVDVSGVLAAAISWEERAKHVLGSMAPMSDFEDAIRTSDDIFVILPSLHDVKDAVSMAKSWIRSSQPFLTSAPSAGHASNSLLKVDALKELVSQSKYLKISLEEPLMLQSILKDCVKWEHDACSLLDFAESLSNTFDIDARIADGLPTKIEGLIIRIWSAITDALSLGFDFFEIPKLQNALSTLQWCLRALSFCSSSPSLEEVEGLMADVKHLPAACTSSVLERSLIDGVKWLKKVLEVIPVPCNQRICTLSDVEEVLEESQRIKVSFPGMVNRLANAIEKHKSWQEQVHVFFNSNPGEQSWSVLLQLKEFGKSDAFKCSELDMVLSEIEKVEKWMLRCKDIVRPSFGEVKPLSKSLSQIRHSLDRSLQIYDNSKDLKVRSLCLRCSIDSEDQELLTCITCKDWYHLSCLGSALSDTIATKEFTCPYCLYMESGIVPRSGARPLRIHVISHGISNTVVKHPSRFQGEPALFFSAEEIERSSSPFKLTLIAKCAYGRPSLAELKVFIKKNIHTKLDFAISILDERHTLIRFESEDDYLAVWIKEYTCEKEDQSKEKPVHDNTMETNGRIPFGEGLNEGARKTNSDFIDGVTDPLVQYIQFDQSIRVVSHRTEGALYSFGKNQAFEKRGDTKNLEESSPEVIKQFSGGTVQVQPRIEERDMVQKLVEKALACNVCLTEIVDCALAYLDKDLSYISERLMIALKAVEVAGVYDHQGCRNLELALARNSWKIRVNKLLEGSQKPLIQQIQRLLKELIIMWQGLTLNIPSEDHFMLKLTEVKRIGLEWVDNAKKVTLDSGALGLDEVFKLVTEGENLPVHFEKELKLLRDRSVLYCICRKPYDHRAMIACDQCDEWYHFDCINLHATPAKTYICPACEPLTEELLPLSPLMNLEKRSSGATHGEPQTPSPRHTELKRRPKKARSNLPQKMLVATDLSNILRCSTGINRLLWRNRKPLRRAARKRAELESLSPFFHTRQ